MEAHEPRIVHGAASPSRAFSPEGVDVTLIRWMLSLTPAERLEVLQKNTSSILRLRRLGNRT